MSKIKIKIVGIKGIPKDIPRGAVFCSARSFTSAMNDLADVFKPHKYGWPAPKNDIASAVIDALESKDEGVLFFAVFGLAREG